MTARPDGDDGMTLVELLISIVVLGIIIFPLIMVLEFSFTTASATTQRTEDSAGAQLLSSYFPTDVQGSDFVWSSAHPTNFATAFPALDSTQPPSPSIQCGSTGGSTQTVLELQWQDLSNAITAVTYDVVTPSGGGDATFVRHTYSVDVAGNTCTPSGSTTVVYALDNSAGKAPTVVCAPVSCVTPQTVQMTLNAFATTSTTLKNAPLYGKQGTDDYTFNLTATRRLG
jgi:prepilin-type N-terminal cleavage/methylation domain-containing protein